MDDHVDWFAEHFAAAAETATPQGASFAPTTSPRSRPALAGSVSMAPMISMEFFWRISRTMDAPMGPTPYCTARIFLRTGPSFSEKWVSKLRVCARGCNGKETEKQEGRKPRV